MTLHTNVIHLSTYHSRKVFFVSMTNDLSKEGERNMIILDQVKKVFRTSSGQVTAVDSVNLEIRKGQIFGIIGYSGAGKSTLIRMLNLLERPTDGLVFPA